MKKLLLILSLLCCCSSLMSTGSSLPNNAKSLALSDGLVAYYPFNGNANDESGNGNHGIPMSSVTLTTGVNGDTNGAYQFGGYDNPGNIHIPNSESLIIDDGWSFAFYVKPTNYSGMDGWGGKSTEGMHAIMGKDHDQSGFSIQYRLNSDSLHVWLGCYSGWTKNFGASIYGNYLNQWVHVSITYSNSIFKVYINGQKRAEAEIQANFSVANTKDLYLGKYRDRWYPMDGALDEVRIYNRVLTDKEIMMLAQDTYHSSFFVCPDDHHPHLIDLGLPSGTKWACCNIGANSPEEYGDYYAWGEIETKSVYNWSTYKWSDGSQFSMNKYCNNPDYGNIDNKTLLEPEDDAAYMNWGPAWRMPTREQQDEIRNNCDWIWATYKNVTGMLIKSRINDSFVFLPAAGYISGASPSNTADYGYYQSASLDLDVSDDSYYFYFNSQGHYWNDFSTTVGRDVGFSVRPISITTSSTPISTITLHSPLNSIQVGESVTLHPTIFPSDATNTALEWKSSKESVATVSNGLVTGVGEGETIIIASATDGSGISGSCIVRVKKNDEIPLGSNIFACRGFENYTERIPVIGLTADGRSQVFIKWTSDRQPIGSPTIKIINQNGQLLSTVPSETGSASSLQTKFGEQGIVYEAPKDFISDYQENYYFASISVPVMGEGSNLAYETLTSIRIYRPGLLLVHGLWGNPTSFESFANYLDRSMKNRRRILLVNYAETHSDSFYNNTHVESVMQRACHELFEDYMDNKIVSASYDFVGHSMGGILSRLFIQECNPDAAHKIITLNTPHWGSGIADTGSELRKELLMKTLEDPYSLWASAPVEYIYYKNPAIYDLMSSSEATKNLGRGAHVLEEKAIPVHAVCSAFLPRSVNYFAEHITECDNNTLLVTFKYFMEDKYSPDGQSLLNDIFNGDQHDGVVELKSQKGGLSDDFCTIEYDAYDGLAGLSSNAHHIKTTKWTKTHENLESLLMASVTSPCFSKKGFKGNETNNSSQNNKRTAPISRLKVSTNNDTFIKMASSLTIENDSVRVDIELNHSSNIEKNIVFGFLDEEKVITGMGRDNYILHFPNTFSGSFKLYAWGKTENDVVVSDSITLQIPTVATIKYINFIEMPSSMSVGQKSSFSVKAIWSNGEETYIHPEYTTSDESILKVNNYFVEAASEGTSILFASYEGHTISTIINVVDYGEIDGLTEIRSEGEYKIYNDGETLYVEAPDARIRNIELRLFDASGTLIQNLHATTNGNKKAFSLDLGNRKGLFVVQCISDDFKGSYRFVY